MGILEQLSFGQKLLRERESRNLTQKDLADKIQASVPSIHRWEHDEALPRSNMRSTLYEFFGKTAETFGVMSHKEVIWNVPYLRNQFFTGRDHLLTQLHSALCAENTVALIQQRTLSGLGGIGKTQTAVEFAYRYADEYEAVLWVQADSRESMVANFAALASVLDLPEKAEADQTRMVAAVKRWLQTQTGKPWLLIFDNADDIAMVSEFLPMRGAGATLLTTRSQITGKHIKKIEIEKMSREEGVQFLLRRSGVWEGSHHDEVSKEAWQKAEALYELMDGLPLALDQAAAYIEEHECSFDEYLSLYRTQRVALLQQRGSLNQKDYPNSVATTWLLSFRQIKQISAAAADLLRLCAFLHPNAIPEEMILTGAFELVPDLEAIASNQLRLNDSIGVLRKYSLIRRNPETKMLMIHRLVQAVLQDEMDQQTRRTWVERVVRMISRVFPEPEEPPAWSLCQRALPHASNCMELIEQYDITFPEASRLLHDTGRYLQERGQYTEANLFLQQSLTIRERVSESNNADVAQSLNDLARLYWDQGKYEEAEPLFERALAIREQLLGLNHLDVAQSLNDFASLYWRQGTYEEAEPLFIRALTIREQELGPHHPKVAESLNDLALLYWDQGRYEQAEALHLRALAIRERERGPRHPDTALSFNNLAMLYYKLGKYEQAEPLYQRALAIDEQWLGPNHPNVATDLNNLANLYLKQGQYEQAEALHQRALAIREQVIGSNHPDVTYSLTGLALIYHAQGRYEEAEPLFQRALAIREQELGSNNPRTATSLNNLARLYIDQGKYEQAEPLIRRALSIQEQILGSEHPDIMATLENYVDLLQKTNHEAEARQLQGRVKLS